MQPEFSILISTKNRRDDLLVTLSTLRPYLGSGITCVVIDDGSSDGTFEAVSEQFPEVRLSRNQVSKGYLYCRNKMLNETEAKYAISLDDDANFVTSNPFDAIRNHFEYHKNCGVIAFRIFWGMQLPTDVSSDAIPEPVKSFVGCGHAWRMSAWKQIPNYPEWFKFYGEEDFSSQELSIKGFSVDYLPSVLVHHRVNTEVRKAAADKTMRDRRALASGWAILFLHVPMRNLPRMFGYSVFAQFRDKVFKGNFSVLKVMWFAFWDLVGNSGHIRKQRKAFRRDQYRTYMRLPAAKIFWKP